MLSGKFWTFKLTFKRFYVTYFMKVEWLDDLTFDKKNETALCLLPFS